ncbi:MAG TPA: glycosyltransferase [Prolixibacteraceae bacterium]|nr:glycosyltransferase [Prolixibacteraceae bacterium]
MNEKHLHIIAFNVPWPPDYGGVMDVFYRLKALSGLGVKICLHCFVYGRQASSELEELCDQVFYYRRSKSFFYHLSFKPFIVRTRSSKKLLGNLLADDAPILFEGLHSCFFLGHPALKKRLKIVRAHNIEHFYYRGLQEKTDSFFGKFYFSMEAWKLKHYERVLHHATLIAAISQSDEVYFRSTYGKTFLMLPGHPNEELVSLEGKGEYILYQGDLSTKENAAAVLYVLNLLAGRIDFPFIIAGKNPSRRISETAAMHHHVKLIANPGVHQMNQLIRNAHINLLPTFQPTGFKLKLLNALFSGRHCVVTPQMVEGTGLDDLCRIGRGRDELIEAVRDAIEKPFTCDMLEQRREKLKRFSNRVEAQKIVALL